MMTEVKPWWQSKTVLLNALMTLLGIATYFSDPIHTPVITLASISLAAVGILNVVLRIWFTNQPVTQFSMRRLQGTVARKNLKRAA